MSKKRNNMFGTKVEKNIRYNEETDTYFVQFNFSPTNDTHLRGFPTIEDAREYRDTINAQKLSYKLKKDTAIIRERENKEFSRYNPYPYNAFKMVNLYDSDIAPEVVDDFDKLLEQTCNSREVSAIRLYFKSEYTLEQVGREFGVTRERVRQVLVRGMKKMKHVAICFEARKQQEKDLADRHAMREKLIEAYKENGIITPEIEWEFGELKIGRPVILNKKSICDLSLSVRSFNCLRRSGIETVGQLISYHESDLYKIKNLGPKSIKEIISKVEELGLSFEPEED